MDIDETDICDLEMIKRDIILKGKRGDLSTVIIANMNGKFWIGGSINTTDGKKIIAKYNIQNKKYEGISKNDEKIVMWTIRHVFDNEMIEEINDIEDKLGKISEYRDRILENQKIGIYMSGNDNSVNGVCSSYILFNSDYKIDTQQMILTFSSGRQRSICSIFKSDILGEYPNIKDISCIESVKLKIEFNSKIYSSHGSIQKINLFDNLVKIETKPIQSVIMNQMRLGQIVVNKINVFELIDLIAGNTGVTKLNEEQSKSIEKCRIFRVVGVIYNCELVNHEHVLLGDVELNSGEALLEDEKQKLLINNSDNRKCTFAITYVQENRIYEAQTVALKRFQYTVDLIQILNRNTSFYKFYAYEKEIDTWDSINLFNNLKLGNNIMIQNIPQISEKIHINIENNIDVKDGNILEAEKIEEYNRITSKCYCNNEKDMQSIKSAMMWLNKMLVTNDINEAIIYFNISLEFFVNGEKGNAILDEYTEKEEFIERLKDYIDENLSEKNFLREKYEKFIDENLNKEKFLKKKYEEFKGKVIKEATESISARYSLMSRFENLLHKLDINLSKYDIDLVNKLRKARNSIIHGFSKKEKVDKVELYEGYAILAKVIVTKLLKKGDESNEPNT